MAQLVYNLDRGIINSSGINTTISNDGTISCRNIDTLTINGEPYAVASIDKLKELEMRINVLENHIRAQEALKDKYVIVLGE